MFVHVPDQTVKGIPDQSSTSFEVEYALVDQGESVKTLTCETFIRHLLYCQFNFVEYLRAVRGLQQVVFEPVGISCVFERNNNISGLKTDSFKLILGGSFTLEDQNGRKNLLEGKETRCSDKRGDTVGNMFLSSSISDQNMMRRAKHDLLVVKENPKLENEYGGINALVQLT